MQKTMVFIDYQNFNINLQQRYKYLGIPYPSINFTSLAAEINRLVRIDSELIKTFLFASRPCDRLLELEPYRKFYEWLNGLKDKPYFEVIEGIQEVRPTARGQSIDVSDPSTYTTEEKGTDINIAVHMLAKAFQNAYDVAILVSGDTDYMPVIDTLHHLGKIVVLATLPQQNVEKYRHLCDQHIKLENSLLQRCAPKYKALRVK